jgi:hypothetical protein
VKVTNPKRERPHGQPLVLIHRLAAFALSALDVARLNQVRSFNVCASYFLLQ